MEFHCKASFYRQCAADELQTVAPPTQRKPATPLSTNMAVHFSNEAPDDQFYTDFGNLNKFQDTVSRKRTPSAFEHFLTRIVCLTGVSEAAGSGFRVLNSPSVGTRVFLSA